MFASTKFVDPLIRALVITIMNSLRNKHEHLKPFPPLFVLFMVLVVFSGAFNLALATFCLVALTFDFCRWGGL